MKLTRAVSLLAIALLCFASCRTSITIEKRHYSQGYYWHIATNESERLPDPKSELQEENRKIASVEQDQVNCVVSVTEQLEDAGSFVLEYADDRYCKLEVVSGQQVFASFELDSPRDTITRVRKVWERSDSISSSTGHQPRPYKVWLFVLFLLGLLIITAIGFLLLLLFAALMDNYSTEKNAGAWTLIIGSVLLLLADAIIIEKEIKRRRAKMKKEENSSVP